MKYLYEVGDIPILMPSKSLKIVWYPHHSESLTIINHNIYTGHVPCWWKSGIRLPGAHGSSAPRLPVPALQGTAPQTEFLTQRHGTIEIHRRYNHECNETDTVINCSLYISSYVYIEIFNIWSISIDIMCIYIYIDIDVLYTVGIVCIVCILYTKWKRGEPGHGGSGCANLVQQVCQCLHHPWGDPLDFFPETHMGKPWKIWGKTMGKTMETPQDLVKTMETPQDLRKTSHVYHGLWKFLAMNWGKSC